MLLINALTQYLLEKASPAPGITKMAGLTCDGAAVMLGQVSGVAVQLKHKIPSLIVTHCSTHRLSLAACDAAHATP